MVTLLDCVCVILLLLHTADCGKFEVQTPTPQMQAVVGDTVILPSYLRPSISAEDMEVEWFRLHLPHPRVHHYKDGRDNYEEQNPSYRTRTALFKEELKKGNTSLKLLWVNGYDDGIYKCFVRSLTLNWYDDSRIQVTIKAVGSHPVISIEGHRESGMGLTCESRGWHPEPEMLWQDSTGVSLPAGPPETHRDPVDGLYTVKLNVTVQKTDTNRFTCRVRQRQISKMMEAVVHVPDELFYQQDPWRMTLAVLLCAFVFGPPVGFCFLMTRLKRKGRAADCLRVQRDDLTMETHELTKEKDDLTKEKDDLTKENDELTKKKDRITRENDFLAEQLDVVTMGGCLDYETIRKHAVEVTLDPDTAHPKLILSDDRKQMRLGNIRQDLPDNPERFDKHECVLGKKAISSGRFYYEVQVKDSTDVWILGVVSDSIYRKGNMTARPCYGFWTIDMTYSNMTNSEEYRALAGPPVCLPLSKKPQKVGVFVDYEDAKVSFYNVDARSHIYSFTGCTFDNKKLYPFFFSDCKVVPLVICPVDGDIVESPSLVTELSPES